MHCGTEVDPDEADAGDGSTASPRSFDPSFDPPPDDVFADDGGPWLDPDSLADDGLTLLVGGAFGLLTGILALFVGVVVTGSGWGGLLGLGVLFGGTGVFVTRHSVYETVRLGSYATAALVVCVPVIVLTDAAKGGTFTGQVLLFAIAEVPFGIGAALLAGFGYWVGKRGPTADGS
jgi:hypothetical protein